jgi:Uma2 family endonuclease
MTALLKKYIEYTLEEYVELEKSSEERLEFFAGKVFNTSDETPSHCLITGNIITEIKCKTDKTKVRVFSSNLKIKVPKCETYRYADATVVLGKPTIDRFYDFELLVNPTLIVEVLSDSTKSFDLGDKFTYYKSIESFTEYLLIDQDRPHVVLYTKQTEDAWLQREFDGLNAKFFLSSLDCEISLADIYENIEFLPTKFPPFSY